MTHPCISCSEQDEAHRVGRTPERPLYLCRDCWSKRSSGRVRRALREYGLLTSREFDTYRHVFEATTTSASVDVELPDVPASHGLDVRAGPGSAVFSLAGARLSPAWGGPAIEFSAEYADVFVEVDVPRRPRDRVLAALGSVATGDPEVDVVSAYLCLGGDGDALATAIERFREFSGLDDVDVDDRESETATREVV